jgi:hypothetical protein
VGRCGETLAKAKSDDGRCKVWTKTTASKKQSAKPLKDGGWWIEKSSVGGLLKSSRTLRYYE